jgi:DICT domain-containing protein
MSKEVAAAILLQTLLQYRPEMQKQLEGMSHEKDAAIGWIAAHYRGMLNLIQK